ncbi:hypothetical protein MSAN_00053800 [Mycena sanguinolenta]|uniref:Uncharacterized protein n=1 Tax=Mycena sanguinolenta TaxID=230812 RepID=A0A8H6ZC83_9AGAR|nr:hypothetical protein MSAN_00053800 [Mycena sanguinolenta]
MASSTVQDAPAEVNGVNLMRNCNEDRFLGPYDGRVAAHVIFNNVQCFITTNADYVPGFAPILPNQLCLRRDMRWGPDDPTLWPFEYSSRYAHLAFGRENILRVVKPLDAAQWLELGLVPGFNPIPVDGSLESRIHGVRDGTSTLPWYKNPFGAGDRGMPVTGHMVSARGEGSSSGRGPGRGEAGKRQRKGEARQTGAAEQPGNAEVPTLSTEKSQIERRTRTQQI